ncbi:hypothetical protein BH18ACT9_BH18ACT9_21990 [soil metagenome]
MAKPSKDNRREIVEQLRRDQQRSEKRRTYAFIAACLVLALVIIGLGAYPLIKQQLTASEPLEDLGASVEAAGCGEIETESAVGSADHRPIGEEIAYQDAPPAFGPHYPETAGFERKFYATGDRPDIEYLVHNLEHGYTLLWYDESIADNADDLAVVKAITEKFEGDDLSDKFIAVPWTEEDGASFPDGANVALTHWSVGDPEAQGKDQKGIWQYCDAPSGAVVRQFVEDYPSSDSPEPNAV